MSATHFLNNQIKIPAFLRVYFRWPLNDLIEQLEIKSNINIFLVNLVSQGNGTRIYVKMKSA